MRIYTVFEPPLKRRAARRGPERFVFVRDGFYWSAFLFSGLWMLLHRLWLVLIAYVVLALAFGFAAERLQLSPGAGAVVGLLFVFLIGLEAGTLRRWTLRRNRWRELGTVVAPDLEAAERRFFEAWDADRVVTRPMAAAPTAVVAGTAIRRGPQPGNDIVGLFPEPGGAR
jgi:uncharacterized protein DUF2628